MKTKFIGLDGYHEIETLKTTRKVKKHYIRRTVKFIKKSVQIVYCLSKSLEKPKRRVPKSTPTLDACYRNARNGKKYEYSVKVLDFKRHAKKQINKKQPCAVRYTRNFKPVSNNFLKHKAALGAMTASAACVFVALTAVSTLGVGATENGGTTSSLSAPLSYNQTLGGEQFTPKAVNGSVGAENSSIYTNIALAVSGEKTATKSAGLYIDGEYIGAVSDEYALYEELDSFLREYMAGYDDTTSVKYESDVEVKTGDYDPAEIMTAEHLVKKASEVVKVALTTDVIYDRDIPYDTDVEYDDTESADYEEVKQQGKKGTESVTCTATFVNGVLTESIEKSAKVTSEPVNEIVVRGTKEGSSSGSYKPSSGTGASTGSFIWPVPNTHNITSGYGYRWGSLHTGIDISNGVTGEAIVASDGGTVTWAGYDNSGYGNYVIIDHGNGYQTLYGHCSAVYVSAGEYVSQGQTIAGMGSTGYSTGTHLHFEIRMGSSRLDPSGFVS